MAQHSRRFVERVVLVSGAGSGIGAVLARYFAEEGAVVIAADINGTAAEQVASELRKSGRSVSAEQVDVGDEDSVNGMFNRIEARGTAVEVLVNNAMRCQGKDLAAMNTDTWDGDVRVVLTGAFICIRRAIPAMIDRGQGAIVNISSVNGAVHLGNDAYSAAKAGLESLTRSTAVRYGPAGVRANAVVPGSIRTPVWDRRIEQNPGFEDRIRRWYPLGRMGTPEDVAAATLFLASDDAAWITGTTLRVDGGLMAGNAVMVNDMMADASREERNAQ